MQNKCPPKGPSEDFLSKENCVRGAFNQWLDCPCPAEGNGTGLVDPQQPKLTLTEEHSGRKGSKQKMTF